MRFILRLKAILRKLTNSQQSASDFAATLDELAVYIDKDVRGITTQTMIDLWQAIVDNTPVDLGVAASNWQLEENYNGTVLNQGVLDAKEGGDYNLYSGRVVVSTL